VVWLVCWLLAAAAFGCFLPGSANQVTLVRAHSAGFGFVFALSPATFGLLAGVVALAGLSDLLDGAVARWFEDASPLGGALDPVVDGLFFGAVVAAIGVERLLRICLLSVLLGLGVLWLPLPAVVGFGVLALLGAAQAPVFPAVVTATPDRFGAAHTANAVGFQVAASVVGGSGLPALLGFLAQAFGLAVIVPTLIVAALAQIGCYLVWSSSHRS